MRFVQHSHSHDSPLLRLPSELRNDIYRLIMPGWINIARSRKTHIPLLYVCRQIHQECSAMLYRTNAFYINLTISGNYTKLLDWIYSLDYQQVASIRHLKLRSTLKLRCPAGCVNNHEFCFDIHSKPTSLIYGFGCHMTQPSCRKGACCEPFNLVNMPADATAGAVLGVGETSLGSLTAEGIVVWVSAVLRCATVHTELTTVVDDCLLSVRFWNIENQDR